MERDWKGEYIPLAQSDALGRAEEKDGESFHLFLAGEASDSLAADVYAGKGSLCISGHRCPAQRAHRGVTCYTVP